jgi:tetratricopeptide (TPR) repeat protein
MNPKAFFLLFSVLFLLSGAGVAQESDTEVLTEADRLYKDEQYTAARLKYRQHRLEFPNSTRSDYVTFRIAHATMLDRSLPRQQRFAEAIRLYEIAITEFENSPLAAEALYNFSLAYLNMGFVQDAILQLRRARDNYPQADNQRKILLLLADCYYFLDDFSQARLLYQSYLDNFPESEQRGIIFAKLAESHCAMDDYSSASRVFDIIEQQYPDLVDGNVELKYLLAETQYYQGEMSEARQNYQQILALQGNEFLVPFVKIGLAKVIEFEARQMSGEDFRSQIREAMDEYYSVYQQFEEPELEVTALLEILRLSDELDIALSDIYGLPDPDELLMNLYGRLQIPDVRALVLVRLAQHHRKHDRYINALDYYNQMVDVYANTEIGAQTVTEYERFLRILMDDALEFDDYDLFLNIYLQYGLGLELEREEQFNLGIAYLRVGLEEEAQAIFEELLLTGIDFQQTRQIAYERMRYYFAKQDWENTENQIAIVLGMEPEPKQREYALFYQQEIAFNKRDLDGLQTLYLDEKEKIDTPLLRISMLQKLARLQALNKNFDLARNYLALIFSEYNHNRLDNRELYSILKRAWLINADLLYLEEEFSASADAYQRYMYYANEGESLAWSLCQYAKCSIELGRKQIAIEALQRYIRDYPDHYLLEAMELLLSELTDEQA